MNIRSRAQYLGQSFVGWMVTIAVSFSSCVVYSAAVGSNRATALETVKAGLDQNIVVVSGPEGTREWVCAGHLQFRNVWARDFSFAVPGLLAVGRVKAVRDTLSAFFAASRARDGLLPRLLDSADFKTRVTLGLLGVSLPLGYDLQPSFETENGVISIDGNLLLISAAMDYIRTSHDLEFANHFFPVALRSLQWILDHHFDRGLIVDQPPYADWADSVVRSGSVGFTQVILVRTLRDLSDWARTIGQVQLADENAQRERKAEAALIENFWSAHGYLKNTANDERLSADVNWAAVAWGLLDTERSQQVIASLERSVVLVSPIPGRVLDGEYLASEKSFYVKAVGLGGYHDRFYWLWITALAHRAYERVGEHEKAAAILERTEALIREHRGVYEIYDLQGTNLIPVQTWGYKAEMPFTWSSAMMMERLLAH